MNKTETACPLSDTLLALEKSKSSSLDARSEKLRTAWRANIKSIPCDRTQKSISWDALHKQNRSLQSHGSAICFWTEKISPLSGRRVNWWNRQLLGRSWRRLRRRIPGCYRRCFLGFWWLRRHMVSEKVPRQTDQKKKRKKKQKRKRQTPRRKKILQTKKGKRPRKTKKERRLSRGERRRMWRWL